MCLMGVTMWHGMVYFAYIQGMHIICENTHRIVNGLDGLIYMLLERNACFYQHQKKKVPSKTNKPQQQQETFITI